MRFLVVISILLWTQMLSVYKYVFHLVIQMPQKSL